MNSRPQRPFDPFERRLKLVCTGDPGATDKHAAPHLLGELTVKKLITVKGYELDLRERQKDGQVMLWATGKGLDWLCVSCRNIARGSGIPPIRYEPRSRAVAENVAMRVPPVRQGTVSYVMLFDALAAFTCHAFPTKTFVDSLPLSPQGVRQYVAMTLTNPADLADARTLLASSLRTVRPRLESLDPAKRNQDRERAAADLERFLREVADLEAGLLAAVSVDETAPQTLPDSHRND